MHPLPAEEFLFVIPPPPHSRYSLGTGTRLFLGLLLLALTGGGAWVLYLLGSRAMQQPGALALLLMGAALAYVLYFLYALFTFMRASLRVEEEQLISTEGFGSKRIAIADLAGYRTDEKWTYLHSLSRPGYRLRISNFVAGHAALLEWLSTYWPNLDLVQNWEESEQLQANPALGRSSEERQAKLRQARGVARLLNWTGVLLSIGLLVLHTYPALYAPGIALGVLFPWCVVLAIWWYRGLLGIHDKEEGSATARGPLPSVMTALLYPSLMLAFRTFFDYSVLGYGPIWQAAAAFGGMLAVALLLGTSALRSLKSARYGLYATLVVSSLAYGYGSAYLMNGLLDTATPIPHQARVLDMRISNGKIDRYYLTLTPWGPMQQPAEIKVPGQYYKTLSSGDTVQLQLHPGWLGAPWYEVGAP
ncbi:hypothetical protein [Cesiribacter andamanensis]|uniref:Uncharacterized protein n=1 Tax=Cesiribacter andamanensis AMV16 TaxID=1279009 RepID=M7NVW2_9BACT|nr:hypothetical protein [Cesiribacter andamanensis]EMR02614.1 hypothetical protein ADICEAN_02270 [Cesiribacter andamanensis AMV16]